MRTLAGLLGGIFAAATLAAPAAEVAPKDTMELAKVRGSIVFTTYCVLCHGLNADGKGRSARIYTPPPADLRKRTVNLEYVELIVRGGGEKVGRSKFMPPWGDELTNEQIKDLLVFLEAIKQPS